MLSGRMKNITPYVPGEQPQDRKYIKLNTNENPYPPTPRIDEFLKQFDVEKLRLYPDPRFDSIRQTLARRYGIRKEQVFLGNGSDEVLAFVFFAFFDSADGVLMFPEYTYSFYPVYCDFFNIEYKKIPLSDQFEIHIDPYFKEKKSCGIIFANPNAPTGICLSIEKIQQLLDACPDNRVVVIDEAYIDFGGESVVGLIDEYKNLLITRTYSKSLSLAGLRLGFAMGDDDLISALFAAKDSFNSYPVSTLAQKIGEIAIEDVNYSTAILEKIIQNRAYLSRSLTDAGWVVLPSKANFIFTRKPGVSGLDIYLKLKNNGILVRHFNISGIEDFVRITIGKRSEVDALLEAVNTLF